jgi:deferrochelatase/peroxidase EfeB
MASVRFHRLLRRGREYGPPLTPEQALAATSADQAERGIHFICLNANLSRQFEFVQGSWIMNGQFDGLPGETDPLLGNRGRAQACPFSQFFTVRRGAGEPGRIRGLPQFVTMRGGAYFFLPGIATLRYLAGGPDCDPCLDAEGRSARLAP